MSQKDCLQLDLTKFIAAFLEVGVMKARPRFPGIRVTANGNQLVSYHTETRIADAGVFYPITPSTEGGELYQQAFAEGKLNVFGGKITTYRKLSESVCAVIEGELGQRGGSWTAAVPLPGGGGAAVVAR